MTNKVAPRKGATGSREAYQIGDMTIAIRDKSLAAKFAAEAAAQLRAGAMKTQVEAQEYVQDKMRAVYAARKWARGE